MKKQQETVSEAEAKAGTRYDMDVRMFEEVKAIDLPFDFASVDKLWKDEYGITTMRLLVRDKAGKLYDDRKFKGIFVKDRYHRLVTRAYVVFPNQEVDKIVRHALSEHKDLHLQKTYTSHRGDAMFWQIVSDRFNKSIPMSHEKGDDVQIGCVVRNSLGTGIALGADLFTYRLVCSNGAVARGSDLASLAIKHAYKEPEVMREELTRRLYDIVEEAQYLTEAYVKAAKLKFSQKMAEDLAKRIPDRYMPDCVDVGDGPRGRKKLTLKRSASLWEAFNDATRKMWHSEERGFLSNYYGTEHAHKVLLAAVGPRPRATPRPKKESH